MIKAIIMTLGTIMFTVIMLFIGLFILGLILSLYDKYLKRNKIL